jgi:hypothetical protein
MEAFSALGFDTRTKGFEGIAASFSMKANYLKRLRDEYDVVTSSERAGQRNRRPRTRIVETAKQLARFSFEELTEMVKVLLENTETPAEVESTNDNEELPADIPEDALENILNAKDPSATIRIKVANNKVRVYKTSIIKQLKKIYDGKCQLCGCRPFNSVDEDICEAHHIEYFSSSKNNDSANIIILCPNHHRLIHKLNPNYDADQQVFIYPDGRTEDIKINYHL